VIGAQLVFKRGRNPRRKQVIWEGKKGEIAQLEGLHKGQTLGAGKSPTNGL